MNVFEEVLSEKELLLMRDRPEILQLNVGKLCNLTCTHCHVSAGPRRKEIISRETLERVLEWFEVSEIPVLDLTGGAPEMIPDFKYLIDRVRCFLFRRIACPLYLDAWPHQVAFGEHCCYQIRLSIGTCF